mmetsp:Transcript_45804/g.111522  ORF Transcript_45804/g.111522 Transcript_45804/m.111522 type:complete len:242 (-) Transcript_45804:440-1165(-)
MVHIISMAGDARDQLAPNNPLFERLRSVDCVCFDVDSTLCTGEGIDELAQHCGVYEEVKKLTSQAMDGNTTFQDSLKLRLNLIRPNQKQIEELIKQCPLKLSPNVEKLIDLLHEKGVHVYLVSGGFKSMIAPMAEALKIDKDRVYANELRFSADSGDYIDFNTQALTACSGGKGRVLQHIKAFNNYKTVVMVGDGATDLEARCEGGADAFIGYGGNVARDKVKQGSDWFVTDFQQVIDVLK